MGSKLSGPLNSGPSSSYRTLVYKENMGPYLEGSGQQLRVLRVYGVGAGGVLCLLLRLPWRFATF